VSGNCMVCFSLQLAGIMFDPCSMPTLFHALQPILAHMGVMPSPSDTTPAGNCTGSMA